MRKRVTGNYYIPDFSKGLIDGTSKGRIDDNYKRKATELTNFWIKNNNNIAKRPPLRPFGIDNDLLHVLDAVETENRLLFLRSVDLNIPTVDAEGNAISELDLRIQRRTLLEDIGWRPGTQNVRNDSNEITGVEPRLDGSFRRSFATPGSIATETLDPDKQASPDDLPEFNLWEYGTSPSSVTLEDSGNAGFQAAIKRLPEVSVIDVYDKETKQRIREECVYFVKWAFTDETQSASLIGGDRDAFPTLEVQRPVGAALTGPGLNMPTRVSGNRNVPVSSYDSTTTQAQFGVTTGTAEEREAEVARRKAIIDDYGFFLREFGERYGDPITLTMVIRNNQILKSEVANQPYLIHPRSEGLLIPITPNQVAIGARRALAETVGASTRLSTERSLLDDLTLPTRFAATGGVDSTSVTAFGTTHTWRPERLDTHLEAASQLNERTMNTYLEKPLNINVAELPIMAKFETIYTTGDNPGTAPGGEVTGTQPQTFRSLVTEHYALDSLYKYLKFSLTVVGQYGSPTGNRGYRTFIAPDIQVTVPGSDVPAYGQFLTEIIYNNTEYNVFASHGLRNEFFYDPKGGPVFLTTDSTRKDETSGNFRDQNEDPDINNYPNGTGVATGEVGVYLYFQRLNKVDETSGEPIFYPVATHFTDATDSTIKANTDYILYLSLDPRHEDIQVIMDQLKLIGLYGSKGKSGFVAEGGIQLGKFSDPRYDATSPVNSVLKRIKITGATPAATDHASHIVQWAEPEYLGVMWEYGFSDTFTLPLDTKLTARATETKRGTEALKSDGTPPNSPVIFDSDVISNSPIATAAVAKRLLDSTVTTTRASADLSTGRKAELESLVAVSDPNTAEIRQITQVDEYRIQRTRSQTSTGWLWRVHKNGAFQYHLDIGFSPSANQIIAVINRFYPSGDRRHIDTSGDKLHNVRHIHSDLRTFSVYINDPTVNLSYTDRNNAAATITVTRAPNEANNYQTLRERWLSELETGGFGLDNLRPKFTQIKNYFQDTETQQFSLSNRVLKTGGNTVGFSDLVLPEQGERRPIYSLGYLDFLENITTVGRHSGYIRQSRLPSEISIYDRTRTPQEAQTFRLTNKNFDNLNVVDYVETGRGGLLFTDQRIYSVSGLSGSISLRVIHESGFTTPALSEESVVLGAASNKIKAVRYYRESGGYITDVVNSELELPGAVRQGVSLTNRHKVILFLIEGEPNNIYTMSIDNQRGVKGFTKFTLPCEVNLLYRQSEDVVGVLTNDCEYLELDFSKNFNDEAGKWQDEYRDAYHPYECAVTTLPILQVYAEDFSLLKTTTLRYLVVGCNGHPAFTMQVIDGNTKLPSKETTFRRILPGQVTVDSGFSGQVVVKNMPHNGSAQPELRLRKFDDEYIEFSSVNVQLGG